MEDRSNRNIVFSCKDHVGFCPKYRRQVLVSGVDRRLKQIIAKLLKKPAASRNRGHTGPRPPLDWCRSV